MNTSLLILDRYHMALELNLDDCSLFAYDYIDNQLQHHTQGRVTAINEEIKDLIVSRFNILLDDYGVKVIDDTVSYSAV